METACKSADLISCATLSTEPLVRGEWLREGTHVDLVGAFKPTMRETDDALMQKCRIYVDSFEGAAAEGAAAEAEGAAAAEGEGAAPETKEEAAAAPTKAGGGGFFNADAFDFSKVKDLLAQDDVREDPTPPEEEGESWV